MSGTSVQRGRALGEQRGRHQLEHAVLRAGDPHLAAQARAPTTRNASTHGIVGGRGPAPRSPRLVGMVNLTRIYTRTGDDGTTALGDMSRAGKNDPRLAAYADVDEANSAIGVALALGEPARGRRRAAAAGSRTTCSTSAPTCARRSSRTRSTRRCG